MEAKCFIQCDRVYRQLKTSWDSWAFFLNGYLQLLVREESWSALAHGGNYFTETPSEITVWKVTVMA